MIPCITLREWNKNVLQFYSVWIVLLPGSAASVHAWIDMREYAWFRLCMTAPLSDHFSHSNPLEIACTSSDVSSRRSTIFIVICYLICCIVSWRDILVGSTETTSC